MPNETETNLSDLLTSMKVDVPVKRLPSNPSKKATTQEPKFQSVFSDRFQERCSFILDLSYLLYYGHFRGNEQPWVDTQWVADVVLKLLSSGHEVFIAVDGRPVRKQINASYKANRVHTYNIRENMPPLLFNLNMCRRVHIHYNPCLEADDIIFSLNSRLIGQKVIVSSDNDMLQCLGSDTVIDTGKVLIDTLSYLDYFKEKFQGVPIQKLPMYRSITGDASDNMRPPVSRFPHALAAKFVKELEFDYWDAKFPERGLIVETVSKLETENKVSKTEMAWLNKLLDETVPKQKELTPEEEDLIPSDLRPSSEVSSSYDKWKLNYELMRLHAYTIEEISYEPDMRYEELPVGLVTQFNKILRADAQYEPLPLEWRNDE